MLTIEQMLSAANLLESPQNKRGAMLGLAFNLLSSHPVMSSHRLDWHYQQLVCAIEQRRITFYFDRFGRNCGYVWWAKVPPISDDDILRLGAGAFSVDQGPYEEGAGRVWIVDFRAGLGELPNILMDLRQVLPANCRSIAYIRYKRGRRIVKSVSRPSLLENRRRVGGGNEEAWLRSERGRSLLLSARAGLERSINCGLTLELFAQLPRYASMPLSTAVGRIRHALGTKQYRLLRALNGTPLAFYSWLWRESAELTSPSPLHELEIFEWRDGRDALLGDVIVVRESVDDLHKELSNFAQGNWWMYPESGSLVRPLISSRSWLSMPIIGDAVCDLSSLDITGKGESTCEV